MSKIRKIEIWIAGKQINTHIEYTSKNGFFIKLPGHTFLSREIDEVSELTSMISIGQGSVRAVLHLGLTAVIKGLTEIEATRNLEKYKKFYENTVSKERKVIAYDIDYYSKNVKWNKGTMEDGDSASITVINSNDQEADGVTFKIQLPRLETGSYRIENGRLARMKEEGEQVILYVSTDIPAHGSKQIYIHPNFERKQLAIDVTQYPIEGPVHIFILDDKQKRLPKTTITVDGMLHVTDMNGMVEVELNRGFHDIMAFKPGYNKATRRIEVNGRLYMIIKYYNKLINHTS